MTVRLGTLASQNFHLRPKAGDHIYILGFVLVHSRSPRHFSRSFGPSSCPVSCRQLVPSFEPSDPMRILRKRCGLRMTSWHHGSKKMRGAGAVGASNHARGSWRVGCRSNLEVLDSLTVESGLHNTAPHLDCKTSSYGLFDLSPFYMTFQAAKSSSAL